MVRFSWELKSIPNESSDACGLATAIEWRRTWMKRSTSAKTRANRNVRFQLVSSVTALKFFLRLCGAV
jgi:hypothetical protein